VNCMYLGQPVIRAQSRWNLQMNSHQRDGLFGLNFTMKIVYDKESIDVRNLLTCKVVVLELSPLARYRLHLSSPQPPLRRRF
jgi:hypothetical protein